MQKFLIRFNTMEEVEEFVKITSSHPNIIIDVKLGRYVVDAKSYLGVLALGICKDLLLEMTHDDGYILEKLKKFNLREFSKD